MIAPGTFLKSPVLVERLMERRSAAFIRLLADICRAWPELGDWLCDEFGRNAKARADFKAMVAAPSATSLLGDGLSDLIGETDAVRKEAARIRATVGWETSRIFGGRTWMEMEQLVRRYQAGSLDLGVFMLVRNWQKLGERARFAPELQRAGIELLDLILRHSETRLWANLSSSLALVQRAKGGNLRATFGPADWWKLHALVYMMRRPRSCYRTRDVRAHLAQLGLKISSLDFRRFCNRHGIRRDERAGRPRKRG